MKKKDKMKKNKFFLLTLMLTAFLGVLGNVFARADVSSYPADNTGKNIRDRNSNTLTPEDQSENKEDLSITQKIRKSLQKDKHLSVNAKNIKIITVGGAVTLRGPVNSEEEKNDVCDKARQVAGMDNINDQMEVAP